MRFVLAIAGACLLATPAAAYAAAATSVTCAAAVTTGIGANQQVRDLEPSYLPVLAYAATPGEGEFKQLARVDGVPVRLYVYRVNETLMHMQIFEQRGEQKGVLADTPLVGELAELTWRSLGSSEMVTVYCY